LTSNQPIPPQPVSSGLLVSKSSNSSPVFCRSKSSGVAAVTASMVVGEKRCRKVSVMLGTSARPLGEAQALICTGKEINSTT
jgi:hypothetical protein